MSPRRKVGRARSEPAQKAYSSDEESESSKSSNGTSPTTHKSKTAPTRKRRPQLTLAQGLAMLAGTCCIAATLSVSPFGVVNLTQGSLLGDNGDSHKINRQFAKRLVRQGRRATEEEAKPVQKESEDGVEYYMQLPSAPYSDPSAILFMAHGCGGKATQWFPNTDDCTECLGIPELTAIKDLALERGMIAVAASSDERKKACWMNRDGPRIAKVLDKLSEMYPNIPIFGFGSSSGGEEVGRFIPNAMRNADGSNRFNGYISQNKVPRDSYDKVVPAFYIKLPNDPDVVEEIEGWVDTKREGPTQQLDLPPFVLTESWFSERLEDRISPELSKDIYEKAKEAGLLDENDAVKDNPTDMSGQSAWLTALGPLSNGDKGPLSGHEWAVLDELNVLWGVHATCRDGVGIGLDWLYLTYYTHNKPTGENEAEVVVDDEDSQVEGASKSTKSIKPPVKTSVTNEAQPKPATVAAKRIADAATLEQTAAVPEAKKVAVSDSNGAAALGANEATALGAKKVAPNAENAAADSKTVAAPGAKQGATPLDAKKGAPPNVNKVAPDADKATTPDAEKATAPDAQKAAIPKAKNVAAADFKPPPVAAKAVPVQAKPTRPKKDAASAASTKALMPKASDPTPAKKARKAAAQARNEVRVVASALKTHQHVAKTTPSVRTAPKAAVQKASRRGATEPKTVATRVAASSPVVNDKVVPRGARSLKSPTILVAARKAAETAK